MGGLLVLAACSTTAPDPQRLRTEALAAERDGNAGLAAERWAELLHVRGAADADAALGYARVLLEVGQLDGAANVLRRHLAAGPGGLEAALLLARVERARGDLDGERLAFARALRVDPDCVEAWRGLGRARLEQGDPGSAVEPLRRALDQRPEDVELCEALVRATRAAGFPDLEYEALVRRAALREPTPGQLLRLVRLADEPAVLAAHPEAPTRVGPWLQRAADLGPQDVEVHLALGELALREGRPARAVEAFARAAEVAPERSEAYLGWVRSLALDRGVAPALERLERSLGQVDDAGRSALEALRAELLAPPVEQEQGETGQDPSVSSGEEPPRSS